MRLGFTVDVKGNVPVKVIARTFASGNYHVAKIAKLIRANSSTSLIAFLIVAKHLFHMLSDCY